MSREHRLRRRIHACAKRQRGVLLTRVDRAVRESDLDRPPAVRFDVRFTHEPLDRRDRGLKRQTLGRLDVELPAEERHGESLFEKEAVAEIPRLGRQVTLLGAAHDRERLIAAAIDDFEEHAAPRPVGLFGPEEQEVRGELDLAVGILRSEVDVGDGAIGRQPRVDRKMHAADHPLVRADIVSTSHVNPDDFCRRNLSDQQQKPQARRPRYLPHLLIRSSPGFHIVFAIAFPIRASYFAGAGSFSVNQPDTTAPISMVVLFKHHHVAVPMDANISQFDPRGPNARLLKVFHGAMVVWRVIGRFCSENQDR